MRAAAEFDAVFLPFLVGYVLEDFVDGCADGDDADGIGVLFFKDFTDAADCLGDVERDVFSVDLNVCLNVV